MNSNDHSMEEQHGNMPNMPSALDQQQGQQASNNTNTNSNTMTMSEGESMNLNLNLNLDNSLEEARMLSVGTNIVNNNNVDPHGNTTININPNNSLLSDLYNINNSIKYSPVPASGMPDTPSNISAENALANMSMQRFEDYDLYDDITGQQGHLQGHGVNGMNMNMNHLMNQQVQQPQEANGNGNGSGNGNPNNNPYSDDYLANAQEQLGQGQGHSDAESDDGHDGHVPGLVEAVGRWTTAEHDRFVHGLKVHGRVS